MSRSEQTSLLNANAASDASNDGHVINVLEQQTHSNVDYSSLPTKINDFADSRVRIRMGFIRKVYGILSVQLLWSLAMIVAANHYESVNRFMLNSTSTLFVCVVGSFATVIALSCFPDIARSHPKNLVLLGLFTAFEGYLVAFITLMYETSSVYQAVAMTAAVTTGLTLYTFNTKRDFSDMGPYLFAALAVLIFGGIFRIMIPTSPFIDTVWACLGALVFSLYIIFDTQLLIMHHSPDEYILCALSLYLDIINLFIKILQIIGKRK